MGSGFDLSDAETWAVRIGALISESIKAADDVAKPGIERHSELGIAGDKKYYCPCNDRKT
jgi:hypothetical protein